MPCSESHDLGIEQPLATLYTIGHSTRSLDDLIASLRAHQIKTLVDIRAFPMSRRLPQFNRDSLVETLPAFGIKYVWMKTLGGYRKKIREDSPISPCGAIASATMPTTCLRQSSIRQ